MTSTPHDRWEKKNTSKGKGTVSLYFHHEALSLPPLGMTALQEFKSPKTTSLDPMRNTTSTKPTTSEEVLMRYSPPQRNPFKTTTPTAEPRKEWVQSRRPSQTSGTTTKSSGPKSAHNNHLHTQLGEETIYSAPTSKRSSPCFATNCSRPIRKRYRPPGTIRMPLRTRRR